MIANVLILDDILEWANDLRDNLNALDSGFFSTIDTKVTKIEAFVATTTDEALKILKTQKIDLFSIDIKLDGEEQGHEFYEKLFLNGIDVPSIVVSAEVNTKELHDEIIAKGVPIIVRKLTGGKMIHIRVAEAICQVLDSPKNMIFELQTYVIQCQVESVIVSHNNEDRTIQQWLDKIIEDSLQADDRYALKEKIKSICLDQARYG